jgi:anti-anti-sigma regulatory factor
MRINKHFASLSLLILELVVLVISLIYFTIYPMDPNDQRGLLVLALLVLGLLVAAWRGWRWTNEANVVVAALGITLLLVDPGSDKGFAPVVLAPMAIAVVMTSAGWTLGAGLGVLAILLLRSGGHGPYVRVDYLLSYAFVAVWLYVGRLLLDRAERSLDAALGQANDERQLAENYARDVQESAAELEARAREQSRLLETLAALETPAIEVAERVLLAPIVGHFDEQRADSLTTRLLNAIAARRIHTLILDITGLALLDAAVAEHLVLLARGVRLLGATVIISGISPDSATALVALGASLGDIRTTSTPADALAMIGPITA